MDEMRLDLLELGEFIEKVGGIESLYYLKEENEELKRKYKIAAGTLETERLVEANIWLKDQVRYYKEQIEIPEEDRMEVTTERLRQIRAKMSSQSGLINNLREEVYNLEEVVKFYKEKSDESCDN